MPRSPLVMYMSGFVCIYARVTKVYIYMGKI
jgi:hypothetical protein